MRSVVFLIVCMLNIGHYFCGVFLWIKMQSMWWVFNSSVPCICVISVSESHVLQHVIIDEQVVYNICILICRNNGGHSREDVCSYLQHACKFIYCKYMKLIHWHTMKLKDTLASKETERCIDSIVFILTVKEVYSYFTVSSLGPNTKASC